jgi:hypothetical protein
VNFVENSPSAAGKRHARARKTHSSGGSSRCFAHASFAYRVNSCARVLDRYSANSVRIEFNLMQGIPRKEQ